MFFISWGPRPPFLHVGVAGPDGRVNRHTPIDLPGPTRGFAATRRLLLSTFESSLETQMEWEARLLAEQCRTADVKEGIQAVLGRRRAVFTGR